MLVFDNRHLHSSITDFDVNYDDYAFEIVNPARAPEFQPVISKNFDTIYLNARLTNGNYAIVLKDNIATGISAEEVRRPQYKLDRIFKYPSYLHQGERD